MSSPKQLPLSSTEEKEHLMAISYMNDYFFGTKTDDFNYLHDISIFSFLN